MYLRKTIIASAVALVLASTSSVMAEKSQIGEQLPIESMPMIEKAPDGLFVSAPMVGNLIVMIVKVVNAEGEQVLNIRSKGEPVEVFAAGLPDGEYSYQVKNIFKLEIPTGDGPDYTEEGMINEAGTFTISNSEILQPEEFRTSEDLSFIDTLTDGALAILGKSLSIIIPDAAAADLFADSSTPSIDFDDTTSSSAQDWLIEASAAAGNTSGDWQLIDTIGLASSRSTVIDINTVETSNIGNSWVVSSNGDMTWANSSMHFDKIEQKLTIGQGSQGAGDITIYSTTPRIRFEDESDGSRMELQFSNGKLNLFMHESGASFKIPFSINAAAPTYSFDLRADGDISMAAGFYFDNFAGGRLTVGGTGPTTGDAELQVVAVIPTLGLHAPGLDGVYMSSIDGLRVDMDIDGSGSVNTARVLFIHKNAPSNSLFVNTIGNVGLGTSNPSQPVHVWRSDGTAGILVEETNATVAPRTLFQIANNGNTKFSVKNTQANVEWAFANPGTGFRLSRQGSGVVEMEILNNGNMVIAGALTQNSDINAKTAITAIDPDKILAQVASLDIQKWEYKDARGEAHIGPMAQDFYATFNLGGTETGISTIDTAGVALVAIQELSRLNASQVKTNKNQAETIATQTKTINQLKFAHQQLLTAYHSQEEKLERMDAMEQKLEKMDAMEQTVSRLVQSLEGKAIYTSLK